ncbi:MAG: hypothetical protein GX282_03775 [Campylobacteraceae bacterium]|nr:hypothetical protein [Campylobacteraceae bacterium]
MKKLIIATTLLASFVFANLDSNVTDGNNTSDNNTTNFKSFFEKTSPTPENIGAVRIPTH